MNEFRQALDSHVAGKLPLAGLERELNLVLARRPELSPAHGALVEALYRSGRITGETYLALTAAIRAFQKSQPRVEVRAVPAAEEKTQFRAPRQVSTAAASSSSADAEKTQFRPPRAGGSASTTPGTVGSAGGPPYGAPTGTGAGTYPTGTGGPTGSRPTGSSWTDLGRSVADGARLGP